MEKAHPRYPGWGQRVKNTKQKSSRVTAGAHVGALRRNADLAAKRLGVGCQYYQPTCVTVTKLRNPFIYKAFQALSCHSRKCDSPKEV